MSCEWDLTRAIDYRAIHPSLFDPCNEEDRRTVPKVRKLFSWCSVIWLLLIFLGDNETRSNEQNDWLAAWMGGG